jgi:hypothetical protein
MPGPRLRKGALDVSPLSRECRTIHLHKTDVVSTSVKAQQLPQPISVERLGYFQSGLLMMRSHGGMFPWRCVHKQISYGGNVLL